VLKAVENVNGTIREALRGMGAKDQVKVDQKMQALDGTSNKRSLGANATVGVSLAVARAAAQGEGLPLYRYLHDSFGFSSALKLPLPMMNILNGGRHADNELDVQEFMVLPNVRTASGSLDMAETVRAGSETFHALGRVLKAQQLDTDVGNEGGYAPQLVTTRAALDLIVRAIGEAGYTAGKEVSLALDVAASEFFRQGHYEFEGKTLSASELMQRYRDFVASYPLVSLEDGLSQDDWQGWHELTASLGDKVMLVGDDLFVTNEDRLRLGFQFKAGNAVLIKPNQIGTLSETIATVKLAQEHGYRVVVSHRSGETMDTFIADLAVAVGAEYLKAGSTSRGERVGKYNRLMEIATELEAK
jgi:enolase